MSLMIGWRKYRNVLPAASETTVRNVMRVAVMISSPDVRRPVTARKMIAPYDQHSATRIAVHTPASTNVV